MTATSVLELRNVTKRFQAFTALNRVSFDLRRGEILALVGENGAGKSTMMRILSGSYPCAEYEGELLIDDVVQRFHTPADAERSGIAMIYQELSLHLDLSIGENIFLGRLPRTRLGLVDWRTIRSESEAALAQVGLTISAETSVRSLSSGEQQLVAIAKALIRRPRILILDEPTSTLTGGETERLMEILDRLRGEGISCIYISHRMDEVFRLADRVTVLRDGCRIATYARAELDRHQIVEDMIGRRLESLFPKTEHPIGAEILRVEHLTVPHPYTPNKNIVEDIGFSLRRGEILGLGGLVGAGRTEIVNALFGAGACGAGVQITLEGQPLSIQTPRQAIEAGLGLVTEDRKANGFIATMDIARNMSLASLERVARRSLLDLDAEERLSEKMIGQFAIRCGGPRASILSLSGGNQQKVILAKWTMRPLKVLMLDEPTRGIDVGSKVQIYALIQELAAQGLGIIMISSELPELLGLCDRFLVLAGGKIQDEFSRAEATSARLMLAATRN